MGRGTGAKSWQQRERIVQTAARIMAEEGVKDYFSAKQKAADRLGVARNSPNLPRNAEIEAALAAYQRLFRADTQPAQLRRMREIACEAMRFFRPFHPRLVGSVLSGVADGHSEITLHLFAESLEQVALHLDDAGIPHHLEERRFRVGTRERPFPLLRFLVDGTRKPGTCAGLAGGRLVIHEKGGRGRLLVPTAKRAVYRLWSRAT